jgi:cytochrome c-type biogenesis protein CcmH/NrfF
VEEVNDYNKRLNYLTKRLRCESCPNTSVSDSDTGMARAVREDIASMLRQDLSDHQILENIKKQHSSYVAYDPGIKIKLYLITISASLLMVIVAFVFKYLY